MGMITHSAKDTDKGIARNNRKIQEPCGVKMLCCMVL